MQLDQILNAAVAAVAVSDVHVKNIDLSSAATHTQMKTPMENKPDTLPPKIAEKGKEDVADTTDQSSNLTNSSKNSNRNVSDSDKLLNMVKQCSVSLIPVKPADHSFQHPKYSIKPVNPLNHFGNTFKPYDKSRNFSDKVKHSDYPSGQFNSSIDKMIPSKLSLAKPNLPNNFGDSAENANFNLLNKHKKQTKLAASPKITSDSSSFIENYVNFLNSDKCDSPEIEINSISDSCIASIEIASDHLEAGIKLDSEIEVSSEQEVDSGIELSDIELQSEIPVKTEITIDTINEKQSQLELNNIESDIDSNSACSGDAATDLNLKMEIANVTEVATEDSAEVNFFLCQYDGALPDVSTAQNAVCNEINDEEQVLDMPILTLDSYEECDEIPSTAIQNDEKVKSQKVEDTEKYSEELLNSTENEPTISQNYLHEISLKKKNSLPSMKYEDETMEHAPAPVEISFFSLDDENLVITSEQALNMFENNVTESKSTYQGYNIYSNSSSNNFENKISYPMPTNNFQANSDDLSDISHLLNIEDKTIQEISELNSNMIDSNQYYLPFANAEEIVSFDGSQSTSADCSTVPTASSEVEILTSDASDPHYTDLIPATAKPISETSSAVSEALQTLVGNIDFESPSGTIDTNYDCSSGTTVDSTLDANGQFVVQVMGSGINMSIKNQYFNQIQENVDPNGLLETISEMDIMDILNIDYKNEHSDTPQLNATEEPMITDAQQHDDNGYPSSSTDTEPNSPQENQSRKDLLVKSKQKDWEAEAKSSRSNNPKKKKCHSSVIAALRESIFRSKARKIVNQLGKDTELLDEISNEEGLNNSLLDQNQNYHGKVISTSMENVNNFGRANNSSVRDHPPVEDSSINYDSDQNGYRPHHYHNRYNEGRGYNYCSNSSSEQHETPADDFRHYYRKHHHKYDRQFKSYTKNYHKNQCQNKCCSDGYSYSSRDKYYGRRKSSSPVHSRSLRQPFLPTSCCNKCKHDNEPANDGNVPVMMLRPEELSSMIRKAEGKDGPVVVMPNDTISNTDGDPLKVQLVYLVYPMDGQRMSADALCHSIQKSPRDLSKSPACGVSCSSSYHDQFSPHSSNTSLHQPSPNFRNKDISWPETENASRHSHGSTTNHKPHRQPSQPCYTDDGTEDPEGYLRKPIGSWTYADVVFFLMEACKEIRIDPNEVQFKSTDNGSALLQMAPGDFEVLAANNGQKLYDYFIKFKTQHYMISESQSVRPSYNYEDNYPPTHQESYSPCDDRQNNHPPGFPEHYHGYPDYHNHRGSPFGSPTYQSPTYPLPPESPSQEYVPQGAQYTSLHDQQHRTFQSPDDRNGRFHDTPSAAGKTFPPLHSYDDPVSDLELSEDEKLPEIPKKRGPGRPPKPENERKRKAKKTGRLWEFIRNLLLDPKTCPSLVRWEDHQEGVFRIVQSDVIANKWGMRKNNEKMNYEKLSRAMRYYYKAKIFEPVLGKRLVYKFGSNAKGWRPLNPNNPNFQNSY